tara:strand:- start:128 stop:385 length:258 start_codon:yes stop_codon:yes gene_type:complete
MATVAHEIKKIFQSQKDRLRNADEPHMMRPKKDYKPLRGVARQLYLERRVKLSRANTVANSGLGLAFTKVTTQSEKKKESKDEKA